MSGGKIVRFPSGEGPPVELVDALEALLFAAGDPVTEAQLRVALSDGSAEQVRAGLVELQQRREASGVVLVEVAGGWQLRTAPRLAEVVAGFLGAKPQPLSSAALEVLSVVAYRQPVTRREIDELRGVGSGGVLRNLLDRGLVRSAGRRAEPGRPLEYRTTRSFLELFTLRGLEDLPTLRDVED